MLSSVGKLCDINRSVGTKGFPFQRTSLQYADKSQLPLKAIAPIYGGSRCFSNKDCAMFPGTKCWHSYCVSTGKKCNTDRDCPAGKEECIYSHCVKLGHKCKSDRDCPFFPLTMCSESKCKARQSCSDDKECPLKPFSVCVQSRCIRRKPNSCNSDGDCPKKSQPVCIENRCVERYPQSCRTASDCRPLLLSNCIDGRCNEADGHRCRSDHDCPTRPFSRCSGSVCVAVSGGQRCSVDNHCPPLSVCLQGKCFKKEWQCQTDLQCPPNSYCDSRRCVELASCSRDDDCKTKLCVDSKCVPNVSHCSYDSWSRICMVDNCGQNMNDDMRKNATDMVNYRRRQLAKGEVKRHNGNAYPQASNMLEAVYDCGIEYEAQEFANECTSGGSDEWQNNENFAQIRTSKASNPKQALYWAIRCWWSRVREGPGPGVNKVTFREQHKTINARGNIVGQQIYAKGRPCSGCPRGYRCNDALCSRNRSNARKLSNLSIILFHPSSLDSVMLQFSINFTISKL
ncbi:unnamed protein product [Nippostrongylus brasiliensis]|uniref:SCP domain-containing protein n=1 Tax=Nippostrongylus brasiliensis TaxID=27835 RepID=A0A0N4YF41_NIPBR|nr:unnamed protein product [Nippostrongylus brasiliensis]